MNAAADRIATAFEQLSPDSVAALDAVYTPEARFKDPFNEVHGLSAIQRIYRDMFESLENPRFVVTGRVLQGTQCFLTWELHFQFRRWRRGQAQCIVGASHLVLNEDGRITSHRDYWDAAQELYEKLPLVGGLMRWLKGRAQAR
jgi:hypothetical protein